MVVVGASSGMKRRKRENKEIIDGTFEGR